MKWKDGLEIKVGHQMKERTFLLVLWRGSSHMDVAPGFSPASAAQQAVQYKEEATQAKDNLEESQRKLQSSIFLEKQRTETIQELQREIQKLQKDSLMVEEELTPSRYHRFISRQRLCPSGAS